jgi:hypothetical protein
VSQCRKEEKSLLGLPIFAPRTNVSHREWHSNILASQWRRRSNDIARSADSSCEATINPQRVLLEDQSVSMVQGGEHFSKPAGSSSKTISRPRRDLLEDNGISAVRVKMFSKHADSRFKAESNADACRKSDFVSIP